MVPGKSVMKPGDEYYTVTKIRNIQGRYEYWNINAVSLHQNHLTVYRADDGKILGESISYSRRGGGMLSEHLCLPHILVQIGFQAKV